MLPARFMDKVAVAHDGCWNWTAGCCKRGYGNYWHEGKTVLAHRFAYEVTHGPLADGIAMHLCDNRKCVNPGHLAAGTHHANMADMTRKGRQAQGADNGRAKLTADLVIKARLMAAQGVPHAEVARRFNVGTSQMHRIIHGESWSHLPVRPDGMPVGTFRGVA